MKIRYALFGALLFSFVASPAIAQVCAGLPFTSGRSAVSGVAHFPKGATTIGIDGRTGLSESLYVGAGYAMTMFDDNGLEIPNMHTFGADAAYQIALSEAATGLGLCPTAGISYGTWDELNTLTVPVGVSIGTAFDISNGFGLLNPYFAPQYVWSRISGGGESFSDSDFGFVGGANLILDTVFFGANAGKIGDSDVTFGVRAGFFF